MSNIINSSTKQLDKNMERLESDAKQARAKWFEDLEKYC